jgi:hypothetical protein
MPPSSLVGEWNILVEMKGVHNILKKADHLEDLTHVHNEVLEVKHFADYWSDTTSFMFHVYYQLVNHHQLYNIS